MGLDTSFAPCLAMVHVYLEIDISFMFGNKHLNNQIGLVSYLFTWKLYK